MIKYSWLLAGLIMIVSGCSSCNQNNQTQAAKPSYQPDDLIEMNRQKVKIENEQIDAYLERRGWDAVESGTGLRYMVYKRADSSQAMVMTDQAVLCDYEVFLIDGTKVYDTEKSGPQPIMVGKDQHEAGLHEGLTYLRKGESAWIVIPSYLAHGNTGDREKIPGDATVIYNIHIRDVN